MSLFKLGNFTLQSGGKSFWKIDCDYADKEDWYIWSRLIYEQNKPFREVIGIPRGGIELAALLKDYCSPNPEYPILIVDDVLTTGRSMKEAKSHLKGKVKGAVVFARGKCPEWVTPLFQSNIPEDI